MGGGLAAQTLPLHGEGDVRLTHTVGTYSHVRVEQFDLTAEQIILLHRIVGGEQ